MAEPGSKALAIDTVLAGSVLGGISSQQKSSNISDNNKLKDLTPPNQHYKNVKELSLKRREN